MWDWVFDVNVRGVVHGAFRVRPLLAEQEAGHFVCTASIAGVTDTPTLPPYGVSKRAVVGLAASMRQARRAEGRGLGALPGLINTKIFESERNRPTGMDDPSDGNPTSKAYRDMIADGAPPSQVAEVVFQAIVDNQFFVFPARDLDALVEARIARSIRQGMEWRGARFPDAWSARRPYPVLMASDDGAPAPGRPARTTARAQCARSRRPRCRCSRREYAAVTVEDIAREARISERTFFRYFASKDHLLVAEASRRIDVILEVLERQDDALDAGPSTPAPAPGARPVGE